VPQIVYVGPFDEVHIPAVRLAGITPGVPFEVLDEAIAASLLDQEDNWAAAGSDAALAAAKRVEETAARLKADARAAKAAAKDAGPDSTTTSTAAGAAGQEG